MNAVAPLSTPAATGKHGRRARRLVAAAVLVVYVLFLLATDRAFSVLDDEVLILDAATRPASQILGFLAGDGAQHQHPPLSDLLLHGWLVVSPAQLTMLRLPAMALYGIAIFLLACAAEAIAGPRAFLTTVLAAVLWPFGFHFGRVAGWYTPAFLLVAWLTLLYVKLVREPNVRRWAWALLVSVLLLWTNYAGWAVVGLLALDFLLVHRREWKRYAAPAALSLVVLVGCFAPLWPALGAELGRAPRSVTRTVPYWLFNGYSLWVSESIAPWSWGLSVPVALAIAACVAIVLSRSRGLPRRLLLYSGVVLTLLVALNAGGTKRLLFVGAWLLLPLACTLAALERPRSRSVLAAGLLVIACAGWYGVASRRHYAAQHFIEPWRAAGHEAALVVQRGGRVLATHPALYFHALREIDPAPRYRAVFRGDRSDILLPSGWLDGGRPMAGRMLLVEAATGPGDWRAAEARELLSRRCRLVDTRRWLPDPGYPWKARLFPSAGQAPWRIQMHEFSCSP